MRALAASIAGFLFFYSSLSSAVVIGDKNWRQVTDTVKISWNDVTSACSTENGTCNGSVMNLDGDTVDLTGWNWATIEEVAELFSNYNSGFDSTSIASVAGINSTWAPAFFTDFDPTSITLEPLTMIATNSLQSLTRSTFMTSDLFGTQTAARLGSVIDADGSLLSTPLFDFMATNGSFQITGITFGGSSQSSTRGFWLYESAVVPVPAAVWMFGAGVLSLLGIGRSRSKLASS